MDATLAQVSKKHPNYAGLRRVAVCQNGHPKTSAKDVFLEEIRVNGKWPTSLPPVQSAVLTPVLGRRINQDGGSIATSGSDLRGTPSSAS